jgi:succinate dehydrogenase / fumarate reductase membrane anchor subunit
MSESSLKSPLGRVRGLGSAKDGTQHWWAQRLSAIAMVPLSIWLVLSLASLAGAGWQDIANWFKSPLVALAMIGFVGIGFWHLKLGLQVVIEDYVHGEAAKITLLIGNAFGCVIAAAAGILSVLKLFVGG